ncbi:MAG: MarR family transcriptional regulator [Clostridiales bacterium]|jgi:DNA-binding MarR family transcriptional regulator|nr:MarR family transcriptional regulator [Clostridiales bacterium]
MRFHNLYLLLRNGKEFCHSHIKNIGISDTEHIICTYLLGHCGGSQDDVAEALKLDKTTVARALLSLEKKGYVERSINSNNRRKYILTLTQKGKENISDIADIYDVWLRKISSCLTEEEQKNFDEYCKRLLIKSEELCKEIK